MGGEKMRQYEMFELNLKGHKPEGSEALADVEAEFTCGGNVQKVKGFYAGDGMYKVRSWSRYL